MGWYDGGMKLKTSVTLFDEGLKHDSAVHCDELVSLPKPVLTDYVGSLGPTKLAKLDAALKAALALDT